jgi:hypothetical protein
MPVIGAVATVTLKDQLRLLHGRAAPLLFLLAIAPVMGAIKHATSPSTPVLGRMHRLRRPAG